MSEFIEVRSGLVKQADGGKRIVLHEKDSAHPEGEIVISSPDRWVEVFPTAKVRELITKGQLIENKGAKSEKVSEKPAVKPELKEDDTAETLDKRYNRAQLLDLANGLQVEVTQTKKNKEIAQEILDGVSATKE